jgi:TniQ
MTRIPEQWVWALDLRQQFPAIGREWFLHDAAWPEKIVSSFCPECFSEQIAAGQALHLKAAWAVALVTRCFVHQLPLTVIVRGAAWTSPSISRRMPSNASTAKIS